MQNNPFRDLETMLERMSKQLEEGMTVGGGSLSIDVLDRDGEFVVTADLPGYEADEVDLSLSGQRLTIDAERDLESETETGDYVRRERRQSSIKRTVRLPDEVDEEGVTATLDDGVLTVTLPKRGGGDGHQIEISDE